jgi:hypothetical protein
MPHTSNSLEEKGLKNRRSNQMSGFLWNTVFDKVNFETRHMPCHQGKHLGTTENE